MTRDELPFGPGLHAPVVLDIAGTALDAEDRRRLAHPLVGGLILFARNWEDRARLTALTAEIKALRPEVPPMRALGELWMRDERGAPGSGALAATDAATACGYVLAAELRACGVDFSFTPVLDLDHGPSGVIGDRAFHRDPRVATLLAKSLMHGLLLAGMASCGKHFPGHGFVAADSHTEVPVDDRSLKAILEDDARPYGWLGGALSAVMPAHVIYPKVDRQPAGFSARWLRAILRGRLGFGGAIFSDDLSMQGATVAGTPVEAGVAALNAGCDLVLLCNQSAVDGGRPLDALLDGLQAALDAGRWRLDLDSEGRRLELLPKTPPLPWDELMHQPSYRQALERLPSSAARRRRAAD
jgi:beta-N-acetylhexosaminidase